MITPSEIREKAKRKVNPFLRDQLQGKPFAPWPVRFRTPNEHELTWIQAEKWIQSLQAQSKDTIGYGYRIEFKPRRFHGNNEIPERIIFDHAEDVFRYAGRYREVLEATKSFTLLTEDFPVLLEWCINNIPTLISHHSEFPHILRVIKAYLANPRPGIYRREFAAAPHSKYLEDHEKLLSELLDVVAQDHIDRSRTSFDARYGFRRQPRTCWVRFLDPKHKPFGISGDWVALTYETLAEMRLPPKILISENRTPLLSLPHYEDTLGIWGSGGAASTLAQQKWVNKRKVYYWGDLDCHGLSIYAKFKEYSPNSQCILMEHSLLDHFKELIGEYKDSVPSLPSSLNPDEKSIFSHVVENKLRLEQERIPHAYVLSALNSYGFTRAT